VLIYASDNDDTKSMMGPARIIMMHDREQTEELFERLNEGWRITTVLCIQRWGDYCAKLTDCCGVQWMPNCAR
jgi:uncharacterized glyoxalase superfamily protein PhnB